MDEITGDELISIAVDLMCSAHSTVAGRFVKVDCEDVPSLIGLCERHGFREVQKDASTGLL